MASLQLPPPGKLHTNQYQQGSSMSLLQQSSTTASSRSVSEYNNHFHQQQHQQQHQKQQQQHQQQHQQHQQQQQDNQIQQQQRSKSQAGAADVPQSAPSYEERCGAAREASKLTVEQRRSRPPLFVPRRLTDFDDGGAFPEIHVAQYPRHMGNPHLKNGSRQQQQQKNSTPGTGIITTAATSRAIVNVEIDKDGKVSYDAIVKGGTNSDKIVYTKLDDMKGTKPSSDDIALPTAEQEQEEAARTQAALMSLLQAKTALDKPSGSAMIHAATSMNVETKTKFIKYSAKPDAPGYNPAASGSRVIQMVPAQIDPMMPPKHRHLKAPRGPAEDPVPVLQAPPRKLTKEEREQWNIPACISNWKNSRGYTIPLDKRLAADGRGLIDTSINNNQFAALSESLYVAEQQARQEVRMRALIQKKQLLAERTQREEELRALANQARLERNKINISNTTTAGSNWNNESNNDASVSQSASKGRDATADDDDDDSYEASSFTDHARNKTDGSEKKGPPPVIIETDDDIAARQREKLRLERKKERERELRLERNVEAKKKQKLEEERDVSEKIALGIHTGSGGGNGVDDMDSRLYNQSSGFDSGFGAEDEYNTYTKPLFGDRTVGNSIYRPTASTATDGGYGDDQYDKLVQDGVTAKFQPEKGFQGASSSNSRNHHHHQSRDAPVQFEKESKK